MAQGEHDPAVLSVLRLHQFEGSLGEECPRGGAASTSIAKIHQTGWWPVGIVVTNTEAV